MEQTSAYYRFLFGHWSLTDRCPARHRTERKQLAKGWCVMRVIDWDIGKVLLPVIYVILSEHLPDALREPGRRTMTMGGRPVTSSKWPKYTSQVHYIPNRRTTWMDICYMLRIIWPVRTDVVKSHLRQRLHLFTPDLRPPAGECDWGINCLLR